MEPCALIGQYPRYLGGDPRLVQEVCVLRGFQEHLAAEQPDDPRRIFGQAVETPGEGSGTELARVCTEAINSAVPGIIDKLTVLIEERLHHDRQRINLNVRAPKRVANQPPISRDVRDISGAGRPLPLAKYLDEREAADPSWSGVRRSLVPFFGMQMAVLKKRRLRQDGMDGIWVEQNHRAPGRLGKSATPRRIPCQICMQCPVRRSALLRRIRSPADGRGLGDDDCSQGGSSEARWGPGSSSSVAGRAARCAARAGHAPASAVVSGACRRMIYIRPGHVL